MAYHDEVLNIQVFIEQVEELLSELTTNALTEQYFSDVIERVKDAQQIAESDLKTIEEAYDAPDIEEAKMEAERVESKLEDALTDIRDCLKALEDN